MGSVLSLTSGTLRKLIIRAILQTLRLISPSINALIKRIRRSPGIPLPHPSIPYWSTPPSPIARHGSEHSSALPDYADVVIIGSGITGTSFARTLLDYNAGDEEKGKPLQVVMLEARDACSGATGRNGGHITPVLYAEYPGLKEKYGVNTAKKIIRFRLSHLPELLTVAREEGLLEDSQCREVEAFDVFLDPTRFKTAKDQLEIYRQDLPAESADYKAYEGPEDIKILQLSPHAAGCLSTRAGAIHPYRLVTGILSRLLKCYPESFHLFTNTPCTTISSPTPSAAVQLYSVTTPKGIIRTPHIIHATNGWVSHLLPGMRDRIVPARGVMTAQRPLKSLGFNPTLVSDLVTNKLWAGNRSFVLFPNSSPYTFDYLTQQPVPSMLISEVNLRSNIYPVPTGELMLGGGFRRNFVEEIGNVDDRSWSPETGKYLAHALDSYFAVDSENVVRDENAKARVKAIWSGILGISVDENPWVGRVPQVVSGRSAPQYPVSSQDIGENYGLRYVKESPKGSNDTTPLILSDKPQAKRLAAPGEWMAAGYSGEGMVHAWMSGKALAYMILGLDSDVNLPEEPARHDDPETKDKDLVKLEEWFPDVFRVSEDRWKSAGFEDLFQTAFML